MLIDDSTIIRALLREVLSTQDDIEVVAFAGNGRLALPRLRYHKPDFVILDYEMPEMNGIETLEHIVEEHPEIRVIMFSTHTVDGARITMRALEIGAIDFLPKPSTVRAEDPKQYILDNLVPRLRAIRDSGRALPHLYSAEKPAGGRTVTDPTAPTARKAATPAPPPVDPEHRAGEFDICAIGISTGGPVALKLLFQNLPILNGSVVITQHMPPLFTRQLAETLDRVSPMKVVEAEDGMKVVRGQAYVAPGDKHMLLKRSTDKMIIRLDDAPPYQHCKPSVNLMYNSLLELVPRRTLSVIMTGMGNDGSEALAKLHAAGSHILAQSEESCVVYGMPAGPTRDGLARESLDVLGLASRISVLLGTK